MRDDGILPASAVGLAELDSVLSPFGIALTPVASGAAIPGTYWGEPEAGLIGNRVYVRPDTPVHSVLHEACHFICMPPQRRIGLHTDAGGEYAEENGVCYLQILLADRVPGMGRARMWHDMDAWGYTFRLGSAERWFHEDAEDARAWLQARGLIDDSGLPPYREACFATASAAARAASGSPR